MDGVTSPAGTNTPYQRVQWQLEPMHIMHRKAAHCARNDYRKLHAPLQENVLALSRPQTASNDRTGKTTTPMLGSDEESSQSQLENDDQSRPPKICKIWSSNVLHLKCVLHCPNVHPIAPTHAFHSAKPGLHAESQVQQAKQSACTQCAEASSAVWLYFAAASWQGGSNDSTPSSGIPC